MKLVKSVKERKTTVKDVGLTFRLLGVFNQTCKRKQLTVVAVFVHTDTVLCAFLLSHQFSSLSGCQCNSVSFIANIIIHSQSSVRIR